MRATVAAPAAMPPKPKMAAMIAMTRNMIVQRNIIEIWIKLENFMPKSFSRWLALWVAARNYATLTTTSLFP